jgi:UDP-2,3-diacylglucosamine hydrolase
MLRDVGLVRCFAHLDKNLLIQQVADNMKVLFISDAHLRTRHDHGYANLMKFLCSLRGKGGGNGKATIRQCDVKGNPGDITDVDDLYILGDFFDFWFSAGDFIYPEFRDIVEILAELKERGIRVHLCEGNHDFFLADYFARHLGMEVITDWATINLEGRRVLISHGDTVDESNRRYLLLRRFLRSNFLYKLQRAMPISLLWSIAQLSSRASKDLTAETADNLAGKMRRFSKRKFRDGFDAVILGHCHGHLLETSMVNGAPRIMILLGDWVRHCSYLCYEDGNFALSTFRPPKRRRRM